jgi:hypothetical protein
VAVDAPYLTLISFIAVIASAVQLVEMFIKKVSPALFRALGIFLPLITTNCAILALALFQTNKGYGLVQCMVYALGGGAGFTLALVLMAGLREKLELAETPDVVRGTALALVVAGLLSVAFMGFAGLGGAERWAASFSRRSSSPPAPSAGSPCSAPGCGIPGRCARPRRAVRAARLPRRWQCKKTCERSPGRRCEAAKEDSS